jgi:uroporphyrinogen-III synthase
LTTKVWITRTEPAAARSAEAWAKAGFNPVNEPLLTVTPLDGIIDITDTAALIFTSAHGVRHCGITGDSRQVYCVGDATVRVAREAGFTSVVSGGGDWEALVEVIEKTRNSIVHVSGSIVRGAIVETLVERGFNASRHVVYRTDPIKKWPIDVKHIEAVALYSPMASETLMKLPLRDLSHLTAYCLSENVAAPLHGMAVKVAAAPNERALIACSQTSVA